MFISPDRRCSRLLLAGLGIALAPTSLAGCANPALQESVESSVPHSATDPLPLAPYRAIVDGSHGYNAEKAYAEAQKFSEVVQACMKEQGFEYFPSGSTLEDFQSPEWLEPIPAITSEDGLTKGTLEYAERYGFGIVEELSAPPTGPDPEKLKISAEEAAYWDSLSESDIEAWNQAMHDNDGETWIDGPDGEKIYQWDWRMAGCGGKASHEAYGEVTYAHSDPEFTDLVAAIGDSRPNSDNDDAFAALQGDWSACMEKAGYQYPTRDDAALSLWEELPDGLGDGPPEPSPEIDAFLEREIATAVADITCAQQVDYDQRLLDLTHAFEQRFIEEHREELDAMTLKYGG